MVMTLTVSPQTATVGQPVTFTIDITDDASADVCRAYYGDQPGLPCVLSLGCQQGYGPWTPPPHPITHHVVTATHVYTAPGTFPVGFSAHASGWEGSGRPGPGNGQGLCRDPYAETVSVSGSVTVSGY